MSITSQVTNKVQEAQDAVTKASANAAAKAGLHRRRRQRKGR